MYKVMEKNKMQQRSKSNNDAKKGQCIFNRDNNILSSMQSIKPVHPIQFFKEDNVIKQSKRNQIIQCMNENVFDIDGFGHGVAERPSSPDGEKWSLRIKGEPEEGLKRDHIIPWETIRKFTIKISQIEAQDMRNVSGNWVTDAIKGASSAMSQNIYTKEGLLGYDKKQINAGIEMSKGHTVALGDMRIAKGVIRDAVSWMPGNIVIAPARRKNDNAGGFDYELLKICEDYDYLVAFNLMEDMIQDVKKLNAAKNIRKVNDILKKIAKKTRPYAYNPNKWKLVDDSYIAK